MQQEPHMRADILVNHGHAAQPHDVSPSPVSVRCILAIKNFAKVPGVCHIGLGVTAANTLKVLRKAGFQVETWSLDSQTKGGEVKKMWDALRAHANDKRPITHVIVSAPSWILPINLYHMALEFPDISFVQLNHSGCAYLSIDKNGIRNIGQAASYQEMVHNLRVGTNNPRVGSFINGAFGSVQSLLLPNLYDTDSFVQPFTPQKLAGTLRIGSFGASRPWKNQLTAAEAAVMLGRSMGVEVELYVNSKRPDGGERMIESRDELFAGVQHAKIVTVPWAPWTQFRDITAKMHILFSPSFDETFNVVTADGIAEGVPSVTTSSLEWTPRAWWATPEDPASIVSVALGLLHNPTHAVEAGRAALKQYAAIGLHRWSDYLTGKPQMVY
jgi:glycosyltransferase involved in cell wall biosynthesis